MDATTIRYEATAFRPGWPDLPAKIRELIEARLGAPVVTARTAGSGFTHGFAAVLGCADGTGSFVKAAPTGEEAWIAAAYRNEARYAARLPASAPVTRLRWSAEEAGWVVLCFDRVDGHIPARPWRRAELARVLDLTDRVAAAVTPSPVPDAPAVDVSFATDFTGWRALAADPPGDLDPWAFRQLDRLVTVEAGWAGGVAGDTLAHADVRTDNILLTPDGGALLCDWSAPCLAAPWFDLVCLLPVAHADGYDADALLAAHPLGRDADPAAVDPVLVALAGYFVQRSREPEVPTSPYLRTHQAAYGRATLRWLRDRLGWR